MAISLQCVWLDRILHLRFHDWDDENRLRMVLDNTKAGYYGYNANGERVYKLTGMSVMDQVNSGSTKAQAIFDEATLYPNPYMVVTLVYFLDDIYNTYYCDDAQHWYRLERVAIAKLKKKMHFS